MPELRPIKVFLCHATEDKPKVRDLYRRLSADGADVWLDEVSLLPGQDWRIEIPDAVRAADAVIVCLTSHAADKEGYIQKEIRFALDAADEKPDGTIYIIPAKLEDCRVPSRLAQWQWVNLFDADESGYDRLLVSLRIRAAKVGAKLSPQVKAEPPREEVKAPADLRREQLEKQLAELRAPRLTTLVKPETAATAKTPAGIPIFIFAEIEFVRVPKGKFLMGSKNDDPEAQDREKPQHEVNLPYDYFMGRYPIINQQFEQFVQATGLVTTAEKEGGWVWGSEEEKWNQVKSANWKHTYGGKSNFQGKIHHPVVQVSWLEALEFIKWLNRLYRNTLPQGYAFRLPSESEWEKAARGSEGRKYPWGNRMPSPELGMDFCNIYETDIGNTTPVGQYSPDGDSPYGCADMAGNVWEWTRSLWGKEVAKPAFAYPYNADDGRENLTAAKEMRRVVRGGSFHGSSRSARCAFRNRIDSCGVSVGFRVAACPIDTL